MMRSYSPGPHPALVDASGVLVVASERASIAVDLFSEPLSVDRVVEQLVADGWAAIPDFVCVVHDRGQTRVLVRGNWLVKVGAEIVGGAEVSTWTERRFEGQTPVRVLPADGPAPSPDAMLPVASAVVMVSAVVIGDEVDHDLPVSEPEPEPTPEPEPDAPALIAPPPRRADPAETMIEPLDHEFDAMFGATVHGRRPEDAAVRDAPLEGSAGDVPVEPSHDRPGDHDGHTMLHAAVRRQRPAPVPPSARVRLRLSTGQVVEVARSAFVGRNPQARATTGTDLPTMVVVDDPYVSSTHVELWVDDHAITVTDVSTNGTVQQPPGRPRVQLPRHTPTQVSDGTVLSLSEDLTITVELIG